MHGLVALDARGRVLRPAILWNDGRTGAECARDRAAHRPATRSIALTGNRALTGLHRAEARCGSRATSPRSTREIAHVLLPKDYVRLRLCGEHATDVADASGTLLFDVARAALERRRSSRRSTSTRRGCRARSSRRRSAA